MAKSKYSILVTTVLLLTLNGVIWYMYDNNNISRIELEVERQVDRYNWHNVNSNSILQEPSSITDKFPIVAARIAKAVVSIKAIKVDKNNRGKEVYSKSSGSGVFVSPNGYIVTNWHVIKNAVNIKIILHNNTQYETELIGYDERTDIAVLKIEKEGTHYLNLSPDRQIRVGEWVLAAGYPFKSRASITAGIVSASPKNINLYKDLSLESYIQTDAAINPGSSGGALVNLNGEFIGLNTAIISQSGHYDGYSFSVPVAIVAKVVKNLKEYGVVQRAWIGIDFQESDNNQGVVVKSIEKESSAVQSGINQNDIIYEINGTAISNISDLLDILSLLNPSDEINIRFRRDKKEYSANLVLRNMINTDLESNIRRDPLLYGMGVELRNLSFNEVEELELHGVKVISVRKQSKFDRINVEPGYIIRSLNGSNINNVDEFIELYNNAESQIYLEGSYPLEAGVWPYKFNK